MPLQKDSFDFLLCRAAFKNFADPVGALQEMYRVLKPGGRGLIIDLKRNVSPETISNHVDGMGLTWFNRILTKLAFKGMLVKSAYMREEFEQMIAQAKFSNLAIEESDLGLEISMSK
jgi:ubiquinone/menaquinone biosynthesis C-methylase UbiE